MGARLAFGLVGVGMLLAGVYAMGQAYVLGFPSAPSQQRTLPEWTSVFLALRLRNSEWYPISVQRFYLSITLALAVAMGFLVIWGSFVIQDLH
jgi:hypothetical protein